MSRGNSFYMVATALLPELGEMQIARLFPRNMYIGIIGRNYASDRIFPRTRRPEGLQRQKGRFAAALLHRS